MAGQMKCGECPFFQETDFDEKGALKIGVCNFLPTVALRRWEDGPCGIYPTLLEIKEGLKCKT